MHEGQLVFSQITDHLPFHIFRKCVQRYQGECYVKRFRCLDQFLVMAFAQLTHRRSLRDIESCLRAQNNKLYHMGMRSIISRSTLADANEQRNWRIHAEFAPSLIKIARPLRRRRSKYRARQYRLRSRRIHDRSLPFPFPMGVVPLHQVSGKTIHSIGFTWKYSYLHPYLRRKAS